MTRRLALVHAARIVRRGGVIAYPTEAVFGLGCLPRDRHAVLRVLAIKRRSSRKGLIQIAADIGQLAPYVVLPPEPRRAPKCSRAGRDLTPGCSRPGPTPPAGSARPARGAGSEPERGRPRTAVVRAVLTSNSLLRKL